VVTTQVPEPLRDLLGPLAFATREGIPIERIGGLEDLVRGKLAAWRRTLPPGSPLDGTAGQWLASLEGCEALAPAPRRARLKAVLEGITTLDGAGPGAAAPQPEGPSGAGPLSLQSDVRFLPGVGEKRATALDRLEIRTVEDLLLHLPARYEDRRTLTPIGRLAAGTSATVRARVLQAELVTTPRRRLRILEAVLADDAGLGGQVLARWFNQPHRARQLAAGAEYLFAGRVAHDRRGLGLVLENPEFEPWEEGDAALHTGRLVPVYPVTEGITTRQLRRWVATALERAAVPDFLPASLRDRLGLPDRAGAFALVHRPDSPEASAAATRRLVFEEFLCLQVGLALKHQTEERRHTRARFAAAPGPLERALRGALPFALTPAQERVLGEIFGDLARGVPMHRLLQGDVGCGKTAVAVLALVRAVDNGFQGALMAPTEILADQHHRRLAQLLGDLPVVVELLVGGRRGKAAVLKRIAAGETHLVVGTQALIQAGVTFQRLGLAVVDEQHRFGVRQRARIGEKGEAPHVLIMTATPIPRSLAMTAYGDLDLSVIDALPPGRRPVATRLFSEARREAVYARVRKEVEAGRQAYVVFPLVEESEKLDLAAATEAREALAAGPLAGIPLGLLHGRMNGAEKAAVMDAFARGAVRVLVATTVVEVGVDVPEATVMVVEHAERFGLSQLHQLRGRVGRGRHPGQCLLIASYAVSKDGRERLKALVETNDGFRIAERDLEIRGPGELFGQRQSGLPELKVANIIRDGRLLAVAREAARELIAADPDLDAPEHRPLRRAVAARWRHRLKWGTVG
jgi:ATP-dependent DNA helicase RecG